MKFFDGFLDKHKERIVGLDILRSTAILIVVYVHGVNLLPEKLYSLYMNINFLKIDGVSIFFVLSGFLIGGILLKIISRTNFTHKDLLNFWIRRWFRTIPNYLFVLIGLLVCSLIVHKDFGCFNFKYMFFSQNFASDHPDFFPEAWSLTIEEWFYLLFPISCYGFYKIIKNKAKSILISALIFLFIPLILRIIKYELGIGVDNFDSEFRKIMILRLDSLMYGVIAAYLNFKKPGLWNKYKYQFLVSGIFFIILLLLNPLNWKDFYKPLSFNIESITAFCFLPFLSSLKSTKVKALDVFFVFISLISYSMYLLNFSPVLYYLIPTINSLIGRNDFPIEEVFVSNYIIYYSATIIGSYLLYRFYENPMTKLRDKIIK